MIFELRAVETARQEALTKGTLEVALKSNLTGSVGIGSGAKRNELAGNIAREVSGILDNINGVIRANPNYRSDSAVKDQLTALVKQLGETVSQMIRDSPNEEQKAAGQSFTFDQKKFQDSLSQEIGLIEKKGMFAELHDWAKRQF